MNQTMLIADDNIMNREILSLLFHEQFEILEATNGKEALEVLESCRGHVDIVLLDLFMPVMDGLVLLERRREYDFLQDVPIVVITSSNTIEDQTRAFELGAADFVNKPFIPEIVVSRVNNVMASHQRMLSVQLEASRLRRKSEMDGMTGLYNKVTTEHIIAETLRDQPDALHAMLIIDIDNFKAVNDISGHQMGDRTIRIVADLISSQFRKSDIVGRIGGDEFAVLMVGVSSITIVREKVKSLIQLMKYKPNLTLPENVSLSIGLASTGGEPTTYEELFKWADESLYQAKQAGKARYREYGVTPIDFANDTRPAVILMSRNRGVCSAVNTVVPGELRVIETVGPDELTLLSQHDRDRVVLACIDVSGEEDSAAGMWQCIRACGWLPLGKVLAICREGDLQQLGAAIAAGVADVMSAPLDTAGFKRRAEKLLVQNGTAEEK